MKFSKPVLFFGCAGLGLTLAYSQQSNSAAQQKALDVLRQTQAGQGAPAPAAPAAPRASASAPSRDQLLADVERLRNEGRITDQQYATFKKNIQEQYANTANPTQSQALAQKALAQKIQQLKTGMTSPVPPPSQPVAAPAPVAPAVAAAPARTQAQPKAAPQAPAPAPRPAAAAAAVAAPAAAAAPARTALTPQRTNTIPATTYSTLSPQQEAQAREILRQKIAETNSQVPAQKAAVAAPVVSAAPRSAPAPAPAPAPRPAPAVRAAAAPVVVAQSPAPAPLTAATTPVPPSNPAAQARAVEAYRDYYIIGIPPGTPELVRILRVRVAELNGHITPQEAQSIRLASRFFGPSPWAVAATDPRTEIPFPTRNPEGLVQLNQLNALYRSNLISPGDYHQQRAKLVATL